MSKKEDKSIDKVMGKMLAHIKNADSLSEAEVSSGSGDVPISTVMDIEKTTSMFGKLVRMIMIKEKIHVSNLRQGIAVKTAKSAMASREKNSMLGNMLKALARPRPTFYKFYDCMVRILGYELDLTIHLKRGNREVNYRYSELVKEFNCGRRSDNDR